MKKKLRSLTTIFLLSFISITSGCLGDQYGKSGRASNSIGSMGTSEVERLGSPQKNVALGKRSLSGEFVIVIPHAEKIYLGSQYKDVAPSDEFSDGKNDFIVLRCYESTSSFKNVLLIIPGVPSLTNILPLNGSTSSPFVLDKSHKKIRLVQETNNPAIKNTWEILSTSEVRGPYPIQGKEAQAIKMSGLDASQQPKTKTAVRSAPRAATPPRAINKDTAVILDKPVQRDTATAPSSTPETSKKPVIHLDAEPTGTSTEI